MLEDEVAPPPTIEFVVMESPLVCTPWRCTGHRTRAETKAIHDALDAAYTEDVGPS